MSLVSRIGDKGYGTCPGGDSPHSTTGTIIEGASISLTEKANTARVNDVVVSDCSHQKIGRIVEGSGTVFVEGMNIARVGDKFDGAYYGKLISGCGTVIAGG